MVLSRQHKSLIMTSNLIIPSPGKCTNFSVKHSNRIFASSVCLKNFGPFNMVAHTKSNNPGVVLITNKVYQIPNFSPLKYLLIF